MLCSQCGNEIPAESKFCSECGAPAVLNVEDRASATMPPDRSGQVEDSAKNTATWIKIGTVFGYIGAALAVASVVFAVVEPWVITRSGTELVGKVAALIGGSGYAIEPSYYVWQLIGLGKAIEAYGSLIGIDNAGSMPLIFIVVMVVWVIGAGTALVGVYRYVASSISVVSTAIEGCAILAVVLWYVQRVLAHYSAVLSAPTTLSWSFNCALAALLCFGMTALARWCIKS